MVVKAIWDVDVLSYARGFCDEYCSEVLRLSVDMLPRELNIGPDLQVAHSR